MTQSLKNRTVNLKAVMTLSVALVFGSIGSTAHANDYTGEIIAGALIGSIIALSLDGHDRHYYKRHDDSLHFHGNRRCHKFHRTTWKHKAYRARHYQHHNNDQYQGHHKTHSRREVHHYYDNLGGKHHYKKHHKHQDKHRNKHFRKEKKRSNHSSNRSSGGYVSVRSF